MEKRTVVIFIAIIIVSFSGNRISLFSLDPVFASGNEAGGGSSGGSSHSRSRVRNNRERAEKLRKKRAELKKRRDISKAIAKHCEGGNDKQCKEKVNKCVDSESVSECLKGIEP